MKGLPLELKGRLYSAFVHSVLLYSSEVWKINETEMKALVGRNGYLMRRLVGEVVRNEDDKRLTESRLLEMLGLESIQSLIRKRKLQWVAHCARRGEEDLTWKRIVREVEDGKSNFVTIMGYADEELRSASLSSLSNCGLNPRRRRTRRMHHVEGCMHNVEGM